MNEIEFWKIVGLLDWDATGDDDAVVEPVVSFLSKKTVAEIFEFEEILAQKLFALDTLEHAKSIGEDAYVDDNKYFSVDGFLYSRCVVVANGKDLYDCVLNDPKEFPKDMEFEAILYIAQQAYEEKTGEKWSYVSKTNYETFENVKGWR